MMTMFMITGMEGFPAWALPGLVHRAAAEAEIDALLAHVDAASAASAAAPTSAVAEVVAIAGAPASAVAAAALARTP